MITQYLMRVYVSVVGEQIYHEILSGAESFVWQLSYLEESQ